MAETPAALEPITHRRVLRMAVPIVLANVTVPILGAVDTGVVGQMGLAAPIGAVGIGAVILGMIYWVFGFLRMGTTGLTAQAHGAGRQGEVTAMLSRALLVGFCGGIAIFALQIPLLWGAFMLSPASPEVEALARDYITIRVFSAPAAIAIYGISGWLIALERTRQVLILQFWINGLNIALDFWFVLGLGWGVEGVATATFLAEWTGFALGLWLCRDAFAGTAWRDPERIFDAARLREFASLNRDILLRSLMLSGMFVSFLFFGAQFGDVTLAANQVLLQFLEISAFALDGFAFAAEALVGQALGARDRAALRRSAILTSLWGILIVTGASLTLIVFGGPLVDIMTTATDVRAEARVYLIYLILIPPLGITAWMLDGIFIGATRGRDMRNMMAVSLVIYLIAAAILIPIFDNHGVWLALIISMIARGVTLGLKYPALERSASAE